jgi:hypothetical protein
MSLFILFSSIQLDQNALVYIQKHSPCWHLSLQLSLHKILNETLPHGNKGRQFCISMHTFFDLLFLLLKMKFLLKDEKEVAKSRCHFALFSWKALCLPKSPDVCAYDFGRLFACSRSTRELPYPYSKVGNILDMFLLCLFPNSQHDLYSAQIKTTPALSKCFCLFSAQNTQSSWLLLSKITVPKSHVSASLLLPLLYTISPPHSVYIYKRHLSRAMSLRLYLLKIFNEWVLGMYKNGLNAFHDPAALFVQNTVS